MASDNFTNSDGTALATHNSNWTEVSASFPVSNLEINNNLCETVGAYDNASAYWSGSSEDTSQLVIVGNAAGDGTAVYASCRMGSSQFGYGVILGLPSSGNYTRIYAQKNGSYHDTIATVSFAIADDHTFKCVVSGTTTVTIEAFVDGSSQGTSSDSSSPIGSGSPGFYLNSSSTIAVSRIDDWTDLASAGVTMPIFMSNYLRQMGS